MRTVAVIPARFGSTRLPGKPLKDICGKPMLWWVYRHACAVRAFDRVLVAADDARVLDACRRYGMEAVCTKSDHPTAIHRLYEMAQHIPADLYVQVNGDEPLLPAAVMERFMEQAAGVDALDLRTACGVNAITPVQNAAEVLDTANIKMTFDTQRRCTYMSRAAVPFPFRTLDFTYYKHVGLIGYSAAMLRFYVDSCPGPFERVEGIDLLRFVDYGKPLYLVEVGCCPSLSVDTEKDLEEVRRRLAASALPG